MSKRLKYFSIPILFQVKKMKYGKGVWRIELCPICGARSKVWSVKRKLWGSPAVAGECVYHGLHFHIEKLMKDKKA